MTQNTLPQKIPRLPRTPPTTSTAACWQAVVTRDKTATSFVYAVLTTKIYCRPSCPARLARRANVEFYDTPSQAERAGFRPCKRCKPETLKPAINPQIVLVQKACQTIRSDIDSGSKPTLLRLAGEAGLTPSHFHRVFKKVMGVTPGKYTAGVLGKNSNNEVVKEKPLDDGSAGGVSDENRNPVLFQPWEEDWGLCTGLDAWLIMGVLDWDGESAGAVGAGVGDAVLWNDFDALIAAEAEYGSTSRPRQDLDRLTGGHGVPDSGSSGCLSSF
ncbi:metal binding domain of Ada-domain-containing protein [Aspergillus cavernicola]|uniref:Metal binding domain of Ada-domain-containing protein n=1 Tax=Aspergillus cavernicola TaxID=176166 RepID=A0ABR4ICZ2_9EURO